MRVLDLFSGIGGFSIGLERAGFETVAFCEIEDYPRKVLAKHWPDVPIYEDVRNVTRERLEADGIGRIDVVTGGYPCQPFSAIGQRKGHDDPRHLFPEMLRIIREFKPKWVITENVVGHISMGLDQVLSDLEAIDYTTETYVIPACATGAPHRRDRLWILANSNSVVRETCTVQAKRSSKIVFQKPKQWEQLFFINHGANNIEFRKGSEASICRDGDGLPKELDKDRLKSLGNAVVPQIPELIGRAIMKVESA